MLVDSKGAQCGGHSRRTFIARALGLYTLLAVQVFAPRPARGARKPDAAEQQLAQLGDLFRQSEPAVARRLMGLARNAAGFTATDSVNWAAAREAQTVLIESVRISEEFAQGQVVFVEGWILAYSEAGVALLFAAARELDGVSPELDPVK